MPRIRLGEPQSHHRHLVAEARENIHREIEENLQLLPRNLNALQHDAERMRQNNSIRRQLRDHPHTPHEALHFEVFWLGFGEAASQTARETGALNYMSYSEVQQLSQLYGQQQYINTRGATFFTDHSLAPRAIASGISVDDLRPERSTISIATRPLFLFKSKLLKSS